MKNVRATEEAAVPGGLLGAAGAALGGEVVAGLRQHVSLLLMVGELLFSGLPRLLCLTLTVLLPKSLLLPRKQKDLQTPPIKRAKRKPLRFWIEELGSVKPT